MKKRGKAQIAMEYILIITLAMMIILPAIYLFRNYAFESNESLVQNRLYEIGNLLVTKARTLYYYGPPSKTTITLEMPPQVDNMFLLIYNNSDPTLNEYYLGFSIAGKKEILIDSEVPLSLSQNATSPIMSGQCANRLCYYFPDKFYTKGKKIFSIEAIENCYSGTCIRIRME